MDAGETLKNLALEIGFDLAGVAPVDAASDLAFAREWVHAGRGGEMRYLANPKRDDPRFVLPSAESIVCVGLIYNAPLPYSEERRKPGGGPKAWISRYAWGRDYHEVMRTKLERLRKGMEMLAPGVETRVYVDTGPIVERAFARLSGIGWVGKNTCLIHPQKGSWFFLGVVLSNLALKPDLPAPDRCGSCTRCIEACPTEALTPYVMDASRCIAYLTIELKGSIPETFRPAIGNNIFGCDICQDVCPWNRASPQRTERKGAATTDQSEFQPLTLELPGQVQRDEDERTTPTTAVSRDSLTPDTSHLKPERISLFNPPLRALASLSEEDFRRAFSRSPIKRAKYRGWLRNLCVAMGNSGDQSFIPWLEQAARHEDEIVREHARWALEQLRER
ncbi:MAG TPA: tRNA epoxyqueuosine(34) reductase QueG [Terriglobia bacterium]|nr:tRNA epoxyqueuosine(34) reductase QueG [Terriglobia bacterium]